ncbi:hypothetical protein LCGC14_1858620 [marine sediment metagenome]|uniref:Uncharacterized protein n=2 Tax=marine sediment metagenome TaxID=412755 RepID=A0A0F9G7Z7_9ZZZZ
MDALQKHVFRKLDAFIGEDFKYVENEVTISLNQRESYVVMKALKAQERYENPTLVVDSVGEIKKIE